MQTAKPIVKKTKKSHHEGGHGGSWKVAYADFVTAMMAFFLLLWLVTMVAPEKRARVAAYFKYFSLFEKGGASLIDGGMDMYREFGDETPRIEVPKGPKEAQPKLNKAEFAERLKALIKEKLADVKDQVMVDTTYEGVVVQVVDKEGRPIFALGRSDLSKEAGRILRVIAEGISDLENKITIDGHTDSLSYSSNKYTNWELSTDRASAARRELERNGLNPDRIARVSGYAATRPLFPESPEDPRNRRISITVLFPDLDQAQKGSEPLTKGLFDVVPKVQE